MDTKLICTVLSVLDFVSWEVTTGHDMIITQSRMTWLESFSYCSLASDESIRYLSDGEYRGWVGGIYLNSQWMIHKGCHSNIGSTNSNGVYAIKRLTPTLCSEKCKMNDFFALKYNWCVCLHSLYNLKEADSSECTYKCSGSNNFCGERSHFTVYQHIVGKFKPKSDVDQKLACSVIVPRNDTFVLKAVDCTDIYWTVCVISGVTRDMGFTDTYQSAFSRCSSLKGTMISTIDNLDEMEDGRAYWSNIFRSRFLKWATNESFEEICYEVDGLLNIDCVYLTVSYWEVKYIPLPCQSMYTAICKPKQPGAQDVIRQCETETLAEETSAKETSTEETLVKKTSTEETLVEESSTEETLVKETSMSILTSTHESTDKAVLLASTVTYKSTTFSAPSMPFKSTKVVASTANTKEEISTRERPTPSTNHETEISTGERHTPSTNHEKEETLAEETSTEVLTSTRESTETSVLLASTITYKSTTFSASSMPIKSTKNIASSLPIISTTFDYTTFAKGSSTKEHHFSITSTVSLAVLVILIVFVLVCLQISLIGIFRRHRRATQEVNQYELTSPFTEPRMYSQPEIHHYEVVDDIPS